MLYFCRITLNINKKVKINRRKCIKWASAIAWFLLGTIIGISVLAIWYCCSGTTLKKQAAYDPWQIANYLFSIIGALGTFLAVIVALAKEAILKWLYAPSLKASLVDDGITENISFDNKPVPEANSFECLLNIENHGSLAALGCKVFINDIKYGKSDKNIRSVKNCKKRQLRWTASEVDMPIGIPNRIKLFEIINPNSIGTPQTESKPQKPKIDFNGCEMSNSYLEKGIWVIEYFITCKNGEVFKFKINIDWNGEFKSRATDMIEVLTVKIEEQ